MEHGLEYFSFYDLKHIAHLAACSGHPAGSRRVARGAHISVTCLLYNQIHYIDILHEGKQEKMHC